MAEFALTYANLTVRRSISGLRAFVDGVTARDIADAETRAEARLGNGPRKRYREEVYPTLLFLERLKDNRDVYVSFPCDNGPYDALLTNQNGSQVYERLQLVAAIDGYDLRLRLEVLSEKGFAPGFGPIQRNKKTRKAEAEHVGRSPLDSASRPTELVVEAIKKKQEKNYPNGSWLVVAVDNAQVRADLLGTICKAARAVLTPNRFDRVYLVGMSDRHNWLERIDG